MEIYCLLIKFHEIGNFNTLNVIIFSSIYLPLIISIFLNLSSLSVNTIFWDMTFFVLDWYADLYAFGFDRLHFAADFELGGARF